MWRYTSMVDLANIIKATFIAAILIVAAILYLNRFVGTSRSVFILDSFFSLFFITAHRITIRSIYNKINHDRQEFLKTTNTKKALLLIGAGDAAEKVLRELRENHALPYYPVGLLDDDANKSGLNIHGVPVLGCIADLQEQVELTRADEILISISSASGAEMKRIIGICQNSQIPFKVLPGLGELIDGKVSIKAIRDISYKDLLGREEVVIEHEKIGDYITGETILITGAGGSIGSELCRQILRFSPGKLVLLDSSEENIYSIQMELQHEHNTAAVITVLGRIQDAGLLRLVFSKYQPGVVLHAAAYKHVPLIERNPWQAVYNNIVATQLLIEASITYKVERFVLVSTDKAVRPTNVMGASKRVTELLMLTYQKNNWNGSFSRLWLKSYQQTEYNSLANETLENHSTRLMAVRFGNVIGSSGSVIPLFKRQIEKGGPVTVAHPEITRYFMSIEEAAQLILQAGAMGEKGGEIFILKMGEPIKIDRMARDLIRLAGKEAETEIGIEYIGLREGEKLYEELITEGEGIVETHHDKIMVLRGSEFIQSNTLNRHIEQLIADANTYSGQAIKATLCKIIPEYQPDNIVRSVVHNDVFKDTVCAFR